LYNSVQVCTTLYKFQKFSQKRKPAKKQTPRAAQSLI
jgi:hypothetical protein